MKLHGMAMVLAGWMGVISYPAWSADAVELSTRVSGVVAEVRVKPGQHVKKGTVLLRLEKTVLQAQFDEAKAEQARAQADVSDARRELERVQELYKRTGRRLLVRWCHRLLPGSTSSCSGRETTGHAPTTEHHFFRQ